MQERRQNGQRSMIGNQVREAAKNRPSSNKTSVYGTIVYGHGDYVGHGSPGRGLRVSLVIF